MYFVFLAHRHFLTPCSHSSFVTCRVWRLRAQGTCATYYKMRLHIVRLKHLLSKSNSVLLAEFLAGADVDIDLAVLGPGISAYR